MASGNVRTLTAVLVLVLLDVVQAATVRQVFRAERWTAGATNLKPIQPIDDASWIWMRGDDVWGESFMAADAWKDAVPPPCSRFFRFRRDFKSDGSPLRIDVSADERFELILDGRPISRGPHRGLVDHWYYQSYEITGLTQGVHRLEAVCWQLGNHAPIAQLSWRGGFILKADGLYDGQLTTGKATWLVGRLGNTVMTDRGTSGTYGVGSQCKVSRVSHVAEEPDAWTESVVVRKGIAKNICGGRRNGWMLFPTERTDQTHEIKTPGKAVNVGIDLTEPFEVAAGESLDIWWDLEDYYSAYPILTVSGGRGSEIRWGWTESLRDSKGRKGDRNAWQGKTFSQAMTDTFLPDGRDDAEFTTPWWRCGRWCRVTIKAADEPVRVKRIALAESRYPLAIDFDFGSDDDSLDGIVRICRRAVENCAHEMLFDCPYYEQQMYPGDLRIQLQILNALTSDERLHRYALSVFDYDRRSNGMVGMNFPTRGTQESPTYTMCWVMAFRDYLRWHGNGDFLKTRMPGVRNALMNLSLFENADGLLCGLPGWCYVDWVDEWNEKGDFGVPPGCHDGDSPGAILSLLYLNALNAAAEIDEALDEPQFAEEWRRKASRLRNVILNRFWDDGRGAVADTQEKDRFSEHAQCLSILGDVLPEARRSRAFKALTDDKTLAKASSYFAYYLFETYARMTRPDLILGRLDVWKEYLRHGAMTTFESQSLESRSDCHAWSACPVYFLATFFAGVSPSAKQGRSVRIAPHPGSLRRIKARVPVQCGVVKVDFRFEQGSVTGSVDLPEGVSGIFEYGGESRDLRPGFNALNSAE